MTRKEEILNKIEELEDELDELDEDEEEMEEYRKTCGKFKQQIDIMKEETGLSYEQIVELMKIGGGK